MNPIIVTGGLAAINAIVANLPEILAKLGPEAWARAAIMRELKKVVPWAIGVLGAAGALAIVQLAKKDYVRIAGRHGPTEVALEAKKSSKRKTNKSSKKITLTKSKSSPKAKDFRLKELPSLQRKNKLSKALKPRKKQVHPQKVCLAL